MPDALEFVIGGVPNLTVARQRARSVARDYFGTRKFVLELRATPADVVASFARRVELPSPCGWDVQVEATLIEDSPTP